MFLEELNATTRSSGIETKDIWTLIISGLALLVNLGTLVVVFLYTRETKKMQQAVTRQSEELAHQIRLSMMPTLLLELTKVPPDRSAGDVSDFGDRIKLTNEGNGIAVNVEVDTIQIPPDPQTALPNNNISEGILEYFSSRRVVFKAVPFIRPKESVIVKHVSQSGNKPSTLDFFIYLLEPHAGDRVFDLHLSFDDMEGNHYLQTGHMGKGGSRLGPVRSA